MANEGFVKYLRNYGYLCHLRIVLHSCDFAVHQQERHDPLFPHDIDDCDPWPFRNVLTR